MGTTVRVCFVFFATVVATCLAPLTASGSAFTYKTNGAFASADIRTNALYCWVYVARDRTGGSAQTYLWYACYDEDAFEIMESGDGQIPNEHFTVTASRRTLATNTRTIPGFNQWIGTGGVLSLSWMRDGVYTRTETGSSRLRAPSSAFKFKGTWTYVHAAVTGTMLGAPIAQSVDGSIGTSKLATVTIERP